MNHPRLPPKNLLLSLPALTASEAEAILSFIDELSALLWDAYGRDVYDLEPDGEPLGQDSDDGPPW